MQPIREDEEDILARLEGRLENVNAVVARLRNRIAELEDQLRDSNLARQNAEASVAGFQSEVDRLRQEADDLRHRQKVAATRIKTLLSQVEQMDLLAE